MKHVEVKMKDRSRGWKDLRPSGKKKKNGGNTGTQREEQSQTGMNEILRERANKERGGVEKTAE